MRKENIFPAINPQCSNGSDILQPPAVRIVKPPKVRTVKPSSVRHVEPTKVVDYLDDEDIFDPLFFKDRKTREAEIERIIRLVDLSISAPIGIDSQ